MKIEMTIQFEVSDTLIGEDEEERIWLENEILVGDRNLILHSNDIGDYIGEITSVKNIKWIGNEELREV